MRWKTSEIKKLLGDDRWVIQILEPGGDCDTEVLYLRANDREDKHTALWICGFTPQKMLYELPGKNSPEDAEVEMVEVTDGQDSAGGLNTSCEETGVMYGIVCSRLRKAGFQVVPSLKERW